jgi:DNA-nicking Smr family endonuclease
VKRPGRGLSPDEAALWARVAQTVRPIEGRRFDPPASDDAAARSGPAKRISLPSRARAQPAAALPPAKAEDLRPRTHHGLDAGWERKLARGIVHPDFTLDLHGSTLDAAHGRLDHGLTLALAQGARVVLLVTGRDRPSEDRRARGAIRRKFMDWLVAGPHASKIAAIRPAHPRHGGAGAVYLILRRQR